MTEILQVYVTIPAGALIIFFARFATFEGMILEFIPALVRRIKNEKIRLYLAKPLYACTVCMASFWGCVSFVLFSKDGVLGLYFLIGYCMSLSGFMLVLSHTLPFTFDEANTTYIHDETRVNRGKQASESES